MTSQQSSSSTSMAEEEIPAQTSPAMEYQHSDMLPAQMQAKSQPEQGEQLRAPPMQRSFPPAKQMPTKLQSSMYKAAAITQKPKGRFDFNQDATDKLPGATPQHFLKKPSIVGNRSLRDGDSQSTSPEEQAAESPSTIPSPTPSSQSGLPPAPNQKNRRESFWRALRRQASALASKIRETWEDVQKMPKRAYPPLFPKYKSITEDDVKRRPGFRRELTPMNNADRNPLLGTKKLPLIEKDDEDGGVAERVLRKGNYIKRP